MRITKAEALRIATDCVPVQKNFEAVREILKENNINPETQILQEAWPIMLKLAAWSYNPADYARKCKHLEALKRLRIKAAEGVQWTTFSEFFAHTAEQADFFRGDQRFEHKGGCGDFNHCRYGTIEQMRREYERKAEMLEWDYASAGIKVICSWGEFFQYLEDYGKGLDTWYKEIRKTSKGYVFVLQSIKNSKKKLTYLQNWSLNTYGK